MTLKIFGKRPVFKKPIYIVRPYLPPKKDIFKIINKLNASRYLTNHGYYVQKFEEKLQKYIGAKHVILTSSGTIGLQLAFRALDIRDEILMPSFTFVASAHSATWEGLTPVFVDIEPDYFTIDTTNLESRINKKTNAIMGVNIFGNPCNIRRLKEICKRHKLKLIFDSAQALGSLYGDKRVGNFGDLEVFSLHATKIINTLEGGFISTNNTTLSKKIRLMQNFGFKGYDRVVSLGINAKMNELSAAIGLYSLRNIEKNIKDNKENFNRYNALLKDIPGIKTYKIRPGCESNYNYYPIIIHKDFIITRDQLCDIFWKENVITRRYYFPGCHNHPPYNKKHKSHKKLINTDEISNSILCLPCFPDIGDKRLEKIVYIIKKAYKMRNQIRKYYSKNKLKLINPV